MINVCVYVITTNIIVLMKGKHWIGSVENMLLIFVCMYNPSLLKYLLHVQHHACYFFTRDLFSYTCSTIFRNISAVMTSFSWLSCVGKRKRKCHFYFEWCFLLFCCCLFVCLFLSLFASSCFCSKENYWCIVMTDFVREGHICYHLQLR